jgi:hypothetical protein
MGLKEGQVMLFKDWGRTRVVPDVRAQVDRDLAIFCVWEGTEEMPRWAKSNETKIQVEKTEEKDVAQEKNEADEKRAESKIAESTQSVVIVENVYFRLRRLPLSQFSFEKR